MEWEKEIVVFVLLERANLPCVFVHLVPVFQQCFDCLNNKRVPSDMYFSCNYTGHKEAVSTFYWIKVTWPGVGHRPSVQQVNMYVVTVSFWALFCVTSKFISCHFFQLSYIGFVLVFCIERVSITKKEANSFFSKTLILCLCFTAFTPCRYRPNRSVL